MNYRSPSQDQSLERCLFDLSLIVWLTIRVFLSLVSLLEPHFIELQTKGSLFKFICTSDDMDITSVQGNHIQWRNTFVNVTKANTCARIHRNTASSSHAKIKNDSLLLPCNGWQISSDIWIGEQLLTKNYLIAIFFYNLGCIVSLYLLQIW